MAAAGFWTRAWGAGTPGLTVGVVASEALVVVALLVMLVARRRAAGRNTTARPAARPRERTARPRSASGSTSTRQGSGPAPAPAAAARLAHAGTNATAGPANRVGTTAKPATAAGRDRKPAARPRPPAQRARHSAGVDPARVHEVRTPDDLVVVRLAARPEHVCWDSTPDAKWPADAVLVCLGAGDKGCLLVDLSAAPGTVAVRGRPAGAARLARSIVRQLAASPMSDRATVTVVGDVGAEVDPPPGVGYASDLEQVAIRPPAGGPAGRSEVVVFRAGRPGDLGRLTRLLTDPDRKVIPLALGDAPDALWSFTAREPRPSMSAANVDSGSRPA